jgi:hypothetical protein
MPTDRDVERALGPRSVGARRVQGSLRPLPKGRWAVPVVAYMSLDPMPDVVLGLEGGRWVAVDRQSGGVGQAEEMR